MEYEKLSDEQLQRLAVQEDKKAENELARRYFGLAIFYARRLHAVRPDRDVDDLAQTGLMGLLSAIRTFNAEAASFKTYASCCIRNTIVDSARKKTVETVDIEPDPDYPDPVDGIIEQEVAKELFGMIRSALTPREMDILNMLADGMSYKQIAAALGTDEKKASNAIYYMRKKIKKLLRERG